MSLQKDRASFIKERQHQKFLETYHKIARLYAGEPPKATRVKSKRLSGIKTKAKSKDVPPHYAHLLQTTMTSSPSAKHIPPRTTPLPKPPSRKYTKSEIKQKMMTSTLGTETRIKWLPPSEGDDWRLKPRINIITISVEKKNKEFKMDEKRKQRTRDMAIALAIKMKSRKGDINTPVLRGQPIPSNNNSGEASTTTSKSKSRKSHGRGRGNGQGQGQGENNNSKNVYPAHPHHSSAKGESNRGGHEVEDGFSRAYSIRMKNIYSFLKSRSLA